MLGILGGLFTGWFLGLFGFKSVVIAGMAQLFGITINALGYYSLFAMLGALRSLIMTAKSKPAELNFDFKDLKNKNKK